MTSLRPLLDRSTHLEIHHVGPVPDWFAAIADRFGARVSNVEPFGDGPAIFCNKLQQLELLANFEADVFILSDADIVFLSSPAKWAVSNAVRAKIVDFPRPMEPVLEALLERAGFGSETLDCAPDFHPDRRTHRLNCNGGLYVLAKDHLKKLQGPWKKWARFCLAQRELLGNKTHHADQLSFMLAMLELELPFDPLPSGANFPTQLSPEVYDDHAIGDVCALHYHRAFDRNGFLLPSGVPTVDKYIDSANRILLNQDASSVFGGSKRAVKFRAVAENSAEGAGGTFRLADQDIPAIRRMLGADARQGDRAINRLMAAVRDRQVFTLQRILRTANLLMSAIGNIAASRVSSVPLKRS